MYYHYIEEELNFSLMKFTISILKEIRPMQRTIIRRLYQIEVEILDFWFQVSELNDFILTSIYLVANLSSYLRAALNGKSISDKLFP